MTRRMFARYPGVCAKCGKKILVGEEIYWDTDTRKAEHRVCPTWRHEEIPAPKTAEVAARTKEDAPYSFSEGSGYGGRAYKKGQIIRASKSQIARGWPEWLYVVSASSEYIDEDGMSFGVGEEAGYMYSADCRAASEEEAAPKIAEAQITEARKAAKQRVTEIVQMIQDTGERPQAEPIGPNDTGYREDYCPGFSLRGEKLLDTSTIYGTGDWFVLESEWIWYVRNNGSDGANWDSNNVRTGGAGAIGWRIPHDPNLADELRKINTLIGK